MLEHLKYRIRESIQVKEALLSDTQLLDTVSQIVEHCVLAFERGNKVLFCGNGGSAADAQHLAAELSGRFYFDRAPLFSEALHVNSSFTTAVANDYSFDHIYARMLQAIGKKGDVLFALSTSGNSKNIIKVVEEAKKMGVSVIGMTGEDGGQLKANNLCDFLIRIPSKDTPRTQESHMLIGHLICELIEAKIFGE